MQQSLSVNDLDHSKSLSAGSLSHCMYTFWTRWLKVSLTLTHTSVCMRGPTPRGGLPLDPSRPTSGLPTNKPSSFFVCICGCKQGHEAQEVLLSGCSDWQSATLETLAMQMISSPLTKSAQQMLPPCMPSLCVHRGSHYMQGLCGEQYHV